MVGVPPVHCANWSNYFHFPGFGVGLRSDLSNSLKTTFFSIIIDETTDVQIKSQLSAIVQYWDDKNFNLVCEMLDMVECDSPSANGLTATVLNLLCSLDIPKER